MLAHSHHGPPNPEDEDGCSQPLIQNQSTVDPTPVGKQLLLVNDQPGSIDNRLLWDDRRPLLVYLPPQAGLQWQCS